MKAFLVIVVALLGIGVSQAQIEVVNSVEVESIDGSEYFKFIEFGTKGCLAYTKKFSNGDVFEEPFPDWNFISFNENLGPIVSKKIHFDLKKTLFNRIINSELAAYLLFMDSKLFGKNTLEIHRVSFPDLNVSKISLKVNFSNVNSAVALGNTLMIPTINSKGTKILIKINTLTGSTEEIDLSKFELGRNADMTLKRLELVDNGKMIAAHIKVTKNKKESTSHLLLLDEKGPLRDPIEIKLNTEAYPIDFSTIVLGPDDFVFVGTYGSLNEIVQGTFFQRNIKGKILTSNTSFKALQRHQEFIKESMEQDDFIDDNAYHTSVLRAQKVGTSIYLINQAYYKEKYFTEAFHGDNLSNRTYRYNYVTTHIIGTSYNIEGKLGWCKVTPTERLNLPMLSDHYQPTIQTLSGLLLIEPYGFFTQGASPILVSPQGMEEIDPFGKPEDLFKGASEEFINWYDDYSLRIILKPCPSSDKNESDKSEYCQTLQKVKVISLE